MCLYIYNGKMYACAFMCQPNNSTHKHYRKQELLGNRNFDNFSKHQTKNN